MTQEEYDLYAKEQKVKFRLDKADQKELGIFLATLYAAVDMTDLSPEDTITAMKWMIVLLEKCLEVDP